MRPERHPRHDFALVEIDRQAALGGDGDAVGLSTLIARLHESGQLRVRRSDERLTHTPGMARVSSARAGQTWPQAAPSGHSIRGPVRSNAACLSRALHGCCLKFHCPGFSGLRNLSRARLDPAHAGPSTHHVDKRRGVPDCCDAHCHAGIAAVAAAPSRPKARSSEIARTTRTPTHLPRATAACAREWRSGFDLARRCGRREGAPPNASEERMTAHADFPPPRLVT